MSDQNDLLEVHVHLRVHYKLNGENPDVVRGQLEREIRYAIGNGLLTGDHQSTLDSYSLDVGDIIPLTEDEHSFTLGAVCDEIISNGDFRWQVAGAWVASDPQFHHDYWKAREDVEEEEECPVCRCGTVGLEDGVLKCRGECGTNWPIKENNMEKYGQKTEDSGELEKTGSGDILCPKCGAKCEVHGKVVKCPEHGTEPFAKEVKHG